MTSYSSSPSPRIINKNVKQAWSNLKFYTRKTKKTEEIHWFNLQGRITVIILFVEAVKVWNGGICTIQREFQPCLPPSCPSTYQKQLETFEQEMNADRV